jgi:hypothetical protein
MRITTVNLAVFLAASRERMCCRWIEYCCMLTVVGIYTARDGHALLDPET